MNHPCFFHDLSYRSEREEPREEKKKTTIKWVIAKYGDMQVFCFPGCLTEVPTSCGITSSTSLSFHFISYEMSYMFFFFLSKGFSKQNLIGFN